MRLLAAATVLTAGAVLGTAPAAASCRPPAPTAENAARAEAVVYGTVTRASGGAVTLRVDRVLKGQVGQTVRVYVGPGRGGSGGTAVATSVDYQAAVGSDHVIYVARAADGQLETNACIGSHPGAPTAEEVAFFGLGASPPAASAGVSAPEPLADRPLSVPGAAILSVLALATLRGVAALLIRERRQTRI